MNSPSTTKRPPSFYRTIPKIELHRHLEGSLRFETVRELARSHGMNLPPTAQLKNMVQVQDQEPLTFENFLSKFHTLRLFYRSPEIISRITREAIADAAADNVRYMELRFTPVALSKSQGFPLAEVMDWVVEGARQGEKDFGVITRLIVSVNRHESVPLAAQVSYLAIERQSDGIVGLDLAGNEAEFHAEPFEKIFKHAQEKGMHITVHAGEWGSGENVAHAIEDMGAERIGHGIRVLESPRAVKLAQDNQTVFEVCVTSNYQSGVIDGMQTHPIRKMMDLGLNVTVNTDDPSVSQISLSDEYQVLCESLGFSLADIRARLAASARAAFLPEKEKELLGHSILRDFPTGY